jgi:glycosyltransferase involved in cell wall biosynthesis
MERKNPVAAITAFRTAFGGRSDARMIVKVMNAGLFPEGERRLRAAAGAAGNVSIIDRTLEPHQLSQLYEESDCLVSLHRSEGFGLVVAEAMLHGIPVLSTDWSGTTDFVTAENGCPVGYQLVAARDPQHTYNYPNLLWAEPDVAVAAKRLQELYDDIGEYGERARDGVLRRFSADAYADSVDRFLIASKGG